MRPLSVFLALATFAFLLETNLQADLVRTVSTNTTRNLVGRHGTNPDEDYFGVISSVSPFQINSGQNINLDVMPSLTPEVDDIIGRDLQNRRSMPRAWSYELDLPSTADLTVGLYDVIANATVYFSDGNFDRQDFLQFDLILNGTRNNRVRINAIDGGAVNLNLVATGTLPAVINDAEVQVRAGLFTGNNDSFLLSDFHLTANYVSTVPEPSAASLAAVLLLGMFGLRRSRDPVE